MARPAALQACVKMVALPFGRDCIAFEPILPSRNVPQKIVSVILIIPCVAESLLKIAGADSLRFGLTPAFDSR